MFKPFQGIFSIAQTPFADAGEILWDDFEVGCHWIVRTSAHAWVALDDALSLVEPYFRGRLA